MGELIDLQVYRKQKEIEELNALHQKLQELDLPPICPEPYFSENLHDVYNTHYFDFSSPNYYSLTDDEIEYYYRYETIFFEDALLNFLREELIDESTYVGERAASEIEPDGA